MSLSSQLRYGERFLQELQTSIQFSIVNYRILGIARHVEHPSLGPATCDLLGQERAVHRARQDDIGQEKVHSAGVLESEKYGLRIGC